MHSYYYNENFYDFTINSTNVKIKNANETLKIFKNFHHYEYQRAKQFKNLHEIYDKKFNELFFIENAPKDSLNRFLYEQLSLKSDECNKDKYYDSFIPKPKNIYKLSTFKTEIFTNYPLTKPITLDKFIKKYRTVKDMTQYLEVSKSFIDLLGDKDRKYVSRDLDDLKRYINDAERIEEKELHEKFKRVYESCLPHFEPIVKKNVKKIIDFMYDEVKRVSKKMSKLIKSLGESHDHVKVDDVGATVMLLFKDSSFPILKGHYEKLKKLYRKNTVELGYDDEGSTHFLSRIYCVLSRYETFFRNSTLRNEGYGMQGALPNYTFKEINKEFDVTQEMFASPLNCYFSTYCSAFLDTDVYFGSCGSFFEYEPIEGSFQCNPPFTEEVIERMADRIEILLASTELPLSFIVFIPEWLDPPTPGLIKMNKSAFKTRDIIVGGKKHKYVAGTQFLEHRGPLLYAAVHDTHVFFLQNKAGFEKWTPSEDKVEKLKNLMMKDDYKRKFDHESEKSGDLRDVLASKRQRIL
jgi:phosphorylated CTD-interacting factor 1